MADWTTGRVQDRLELAADVFAQLPGVKPTGLLQRVARVFHSFADQVGQEPQMRSRGPARARSPRPRRRCSGCAGWRRTTPASSGCAPTASRGRRSLGDRAEPPRRQPPLAVRRRADHLAAQRAGAVGEGGRSGSCRERRSAVKKNHPVSEFSERHRRGFTDPAEGYKKVMLARGVSEARHDRLPGSTDRRRWLPAGSETASGPRLTGVQAAAKPLFSGSFSGRNVCWRAWRAISPATGPIFWEATGIRKSTRDALKSS